MTSGQLVRSLATDLTVEQRTVKFGFEESPHLSGDTSDLCAARETRDVEKLLI